MRDQFITRRSGLSRFIQHITYVSLAGLYLAPLAEGQDQSGGSRMVAIQRRKIEVTPADRYRVPLRLEPRRSVTINAPYDATVKLISVKEGRAVDPQFEVLRLENSRLELLVKRATAAKEVADLEVRAGRASGNAELLKLAEAKLALADADLVLAVFDRDATSIRAPYLASILKIHVQEAQQVKAGEPLITLGDVQQLKCRLPVNREAVSAGSTMDLTVEAQTVKATVESVAPLDAEHDKQRELAVSAATAVVLIDNRDGKWHPGQVVYGPLSPVGAVVNVPLTSIKSGAGGNRIVQVLRDGIVRDVSVALHGQIGQEAVFVSGQFTEQDELILSTTAELADGTSVKPASANQLAATKSNAVTPQAGGDAKPAATSAPRKTGAAGF